MVRLCWVNFQCWGVLKLAQAPNVVAVGAGGRCLDILFLSSIICLFFLPLSERRPGRLKGPLNPL